ncbi:hypothetical protein BJX99DRAFT_25129 [Aspergillus californicus]
MASGFQQPPMPDSTFHTPLNQSAPMHMDFLDFSQPLSVDQFVSQADGQGFSMLYDEATTGNTSHNMDSTGLYHNIPPRTNSNFAHTANTLDNVSSIPHDTLNTFEDFSNMWPDMRQSMADQTAASGQTIPSNSYYTPSASQPISSTHMPQFMAPFNGSTASQTHSGMQQLTTQHSVPNSALPSASAGVATTTSVAPFQQSHNSPVVPQSGASFGNDHYRRIHQRVNSMMPSQPSSTSTSHRVRSVNHRRTRPTSMIVTTDNASLSAVQQSYTQFPQPSQPQRSRASTTALVDAVAAAGIQQRTTGRQRSVISRQPDRTAQLNAWLRNLHQNEAQALHNQSIVHGGRLDSSVTPYFHPPKNPDIAQQPRPEPKETEELTLNMECKICMGQLVDTVLLPCGHATLCRWCADQHIPSFKGYPKAKAACPMCREPVSLTCRIYFP